MSASNCTTHSHACDCREEKFKRTKQALQKAVEYIEKETCICESIEQYTCEKCETLAEIKTLLESK